MVDERTVGIGVIGIEHLHVFEIVDGLLAAGAHAVAHSSGSYSTGNDSAGGHSLVEVYSGWQPASQEMTIDEVLDDERIDLVVVCGVPAERSAVTCAALRAGKDVVSAKPGVTTAEQLAEVRAAMAASGRRWWVLFTERFANPAMLRAVALARSGAVGDVVAVEGSAPHRLNPDDRPEWCFDAERSGGILVDLGTHQIDQFLAVTEADPALVTVVSAAVGSVKDWGSDERRKGFQDIGELTLQGPGVRGHHRVDFLEPDGFPTWGDTRLVITGTDGRLEVRIPVDDDGGHVPASVWVTDHVGVRRDPCTGEPTWARDLLSDMVDGGERLMSRRHPFDVAELVLEAAAAATGWGGGDPAPVGPAPPGEGAQGVDVTPERSAASAGGFS
ncbi:MAG TPA: Gfo/Idh/MocA family oxidoreductase [Microthrixaceae bacterium]|nr:Gfo/Idh/MocA family oxidoreductase [Microthrixaceae bacterium]